MEFGTKRDVQGKYRKPMGKWTRRFLGSIVFVCASVIGGGIWAGEMWVPAQIQDIKSKELHVVNTFTPVAEAAEIKPDAIEKMKYDVLKDLQMCESGGREGEDAEALVTFDPDKSNIGSQTGSFGAFQFKVGTMQFFWEKKHPGEKLTILAAQNKARDWDTAWSVAEYVIFELDKKPSADWKNCSIKHDLDKRASFINKYDQ
jgi:hypothetical protein